MNDFDKNSFNLKEFRDRSSVRSSYLKLIFSILLIFSLLILSVSLFRKAVSSSSDISFSSFLNWLSNTSTFQFSVNVQDFFIYGDWGLFEFLRNFLNIFTGLFGVIVYLCSNLFNLIIYITQFITFLYS